MSKKSTPTYCLVINCSVAHAAGGLDSRHPTGIMCRDFLQKLPRHLSSHGLDKCD